MAPIERSYAWRQMSADVEADERLRVGNLREELGMTTKYGSTTDLVKRLRDAEGQIEQTREDLTEAEAMRDHNAAVAERLREERDRYEVAIRWVLARNTSGIVLGGYDKPMVMHLLAALNG